MSYWLDPWLLFWAVRCLRIVLLWRADALTCWNRGTPSHFLLVRKWRTPSLLRRVTSRYPQAVWLVISEGDMENCAPDRAQTDESNLSISSPFTTAVPSGIFQIRSDCGCVAKQTMQMDGERSDRYSRGGQQLSRRGPKNIIIRHIWFGWCTKKLVLWLYMTISGH